MKKKKDFHFTIFVVILKWTIHCLRKMYHEYVLYTCIWFVCIAQYSVHCWDYRRFVVQRSQVAAQDEFEFTTKKISTNFSNFSSWHYRSKLLPVLQPDPKNWVGIKEEALLEG